MRHLPECVPYRSGDSIMSSINLKINDRDVTVAAGSTILDAAKKLGIDIPTLCFLKGCDPFTSCMVCVVHDIDSGRMVPSCSMPVYPGMKIETDNEKVREARKDAIEFLLSEHVGDCEAPCRRACPANMNIPLMIRQIKDKRFAEAVKTIKRDIALPAVLGRICPAPCEKVCRRKYADDPVAICYLKRFAADTDLALASPYRPEMKKKTGKTIAIVGAGPTGLSAAYYLLLEGHECFIYDRNPQPGGMLRYGVSREKLPEAVLDAEIERISALGAKFLQGRSLGQDIQLAELKENHDAVVLASGKIEPGLFENSGIELSGRGIVIDRQTFVTSTPGVFAGGSAVAESRMAVRAAAHGKGIAYSVSSYLSAAPFTPTEPDGIRIPPRRFDFRMGKISGGEVEEFLKEAGTYRRIVPGGGFLTGYTDSEAVKESGRCLHCDCRKPGSCKLRRYSEEYRANQGRFKPGDRQKFQRIVRHDRVVYEPGKCIKCGLCVQITKRAAEKLGLTFVNRGFAVRVESPFNEPLSRALEKTAGECVAACPTGALSWRDKIDKSFDQTFSKVRPPAGPPEAREDKT